MAKKCVLYIYMLLTSCNMLSNAAIFCFISWHIYITQLLHIGAGAALLARYICDYLINGYIWISLKTFLYKITSAYKKFFILYCATL